jgi:hypothetical protein
MWPLECVSCTSEGVGEVLPQVVAVIRDLGHHVLLRNDARAQPVRIGVDVKRIDR